MITENLTCVCSKKGAGLGLLLFNLMPMKAAILLPFALIASQWLNAQLALVDQTGAQTNSGLVAMDYETSYNILDCRIADDFTVPSGQTWHIDSVVIRGFYTATAIDTAGIRVSFHQNNSGSVGTAVFDSTITVNVDQYSNGRLVMRFGNPEVLSAGTYWLAAAARKDYLFGTGGVWYWLLENSNAGLEAKWENPSGGWGLCTQWTNITDNSCVNVNYTGVSFQIFGCYGSPKPQINPIVDDTSVCSGTPLVLTATSNSSTAHYAWSNGDSTATSSNFPSSGTYTVTAYDPTTLCGTIQRVEVTVQSNYYSSVANDTVCPNESAVYGVNGCSACSFEWNNGSTQNYSVYTGASSVVVTITDPATGCVRVDSAYQSEHPTPVLQINPTEVVEACIGDTIWLSTTQPFDSYLWTSALWANPMDSAAVMVLETGQYDVSVTAANGCSRTESAFVTFHEAPVASYVIDTTSAWKIRLSAPEGFAAYQWSTGSTDRVIIANSTGIYSLTVTDQFGCTGSTELFVIVTGLETHTAAEFNVYPNPASSLLYLSQWPSQQAFVFDLTGRLLVQLPVEHASVDIQHLPSGSYFLSPSLNTRSVPFVVAP